MVWWGKEGIEGEERMEGEIRGMVGRERRGLVRVGERRGVVGKGEDASGVERRVVEREEWLGDEGSDEDGRKEVWCGEERRGERKRGQWW